MGALQVALTRRSTIKIVLSAGYIRLFVITVDRSTDRHRTTSRLWRVHGPCRAPGGGGAIAGHPARGGPLLSIEPGAANFPGDLRFSPRLCGRYLGDAARPADPQQTPGDSDRLHAREEPPGRKRLRPGGSSSYCWSHLQGRQDSNLRHLVLETNAVSEPVGPGPRVRPLPPRSQRPRRRSLGDQLGSTASSARGSSWRPGRCPQARPAAPAALRASGAGTRP